MTVLRGDLSIDGQRLPGGEHLMIGDCFRSGGCIYDVVRREWNTDAVTGSLELTLTLAKC